MNRIVTGGRSLEQPQLLPLIGASAHRGAAASGELVPLKAVEDLSGARHNGSRQTCQALGSPGLTHSPEVNQRSAGSRC